MPQPPEPTVSVLDAIEPVVLGEPGRISTRTLLIVTAASLAMLLVAVVVAVWLNWPGSLTPIPVSHG